MNESLPVTDSSAFTTTLLHPLRTDVAQPRQLNNPFDYHPHPLSRLAIREVQACIQAMQSWQEEVAQGKMFGVLVVDCGKQELGFLAAYSGQIGGRADWPGFVPAVFDYLQPDGYFKRHEKQITEYTIRINEQETADGYLALKASLETFERQAEKQLSDYRESMRHAKLRRDRLRQSGVLSADEAASLIRESQHMKAGLRRLRQRLEAEADILRARLQTEEEAIRQLKVTRRQLSDHLQRWLFAHFVMLNAQGGQRNLLDIFASTPQQIPPAGAGECCAPKLLQYAYQHQLKPVCMAEFWWGASPKTSVRHHGECYPACRGKCLPILTFMLQGLEVEDERLDAAQTATPATIYQDRDILVVDKPAGLLSVPGRSDRASVLSVMQQSMPAGTELLAVHRLDMDTSGLLILAKSLDAYRHLQAQFKAHTIKKEYVAVLEGQIPHTSGTIDLPLRPDPLDRPRQVVDRESGKKAVTLYNVLSARNGQTFISLHPLTGRTHQLRMHCAHQEGLGCPILGDPLYGHTADRLYLHASSISFTHPVSGKRITLTAPVPDCFKQVK